MASMGAHASWCGMTGEAPNDDENVVYRWAVDILRPYDPAGEQLAAVLAMLLMVAVVLGLLALSACYLVILAFIARANQLAPFPVFAIGMLAPMALVIASLMIVHVVQHRGARPPL
jgi:hypothetical protein